MTPSVATTEPANPPGVPLPDFNDNQSRALFDRWRSDYTYMPGATLSNEDLAGIVTKSLSQTIELIHEQKGPLALLIGKDPLSRMDFLSDPTIKKLLCATAFVNGNEKRKEGDAYEMAHSCDVATLTYITLIKQGFGSARCRLAAALGLTHDISEASRGRYMHNGQRIIQLNIPNNTKRNLLRQEDDHLVSGIIKPCWMGDPELERNFVEGTWSLTDCIDYYILPKSDETRDARLTSQKKVAPTYSLEEAYAKFWDKFATVLRDIHSGNKSVECMAANLTKAPIVHALPDDAFDLTKDPYSTQNPYSLKNLYYKTLLDFTKSTYPYAFRAIKENLDWMIKRVARTENSAFLPPPPDIKPSAFKRQFLLFANNLNGVNEKGFPEDPIHPALRPVTPLNNTTQRRWPFRPLVCSS